MPGFMEEYSSRPRGTLVLSAALAGLALALPLSLAAFYRSTFRNLRKTDEDGFLYSVEYTGNYKSKLISFMPGLVRGSGCANFRTFGKNGDVLTGRNYDIPHLDKKGNPTGLNVAVRLKSRGRYDSINFADAAWFSYIGLPYFKGALDRGKCVRFPLAFLPWLCMDGMNEKGLTVSILFVDVRGGERPVFQNEPGKDHLIISQMLRMLLDSCADVSEAEEMAKSVNLVNMKGNDYHLFLSDAKGVSAVFEWRYNNFTVTYTDAVTNFYAGYGDAADCWYGDRLKEAFAPPEKLRRPYRYGYGHGYERFGKIAKALDSRMTDSATLRTEMSVGEAMDILKSVYQQYDPDSLTSLTQYSCVYNSTRLTADVCVAGDYGRVYSFSFK